MAGNFGPDGKQAMDMAQAHTVTVGPGGSLHFRFSFNAYNENAVIIYDAETLEKVALRENYFRPGDIDFDFQNNEAHPVSFLITGWHKDDLPDAYLPWHQSIKKVFFENSKAVSVGFEDLGGDLDFDDALVTVNIRGPRLKWAFNIALLVSSALVVFAAVRLLNSARQDIKGDHPTTRLTP
jgi:hypothetical protein